MLAALAASGKELKNRFGIFSFVDLEEIETTTSAVLRALDSDRTWNEKRCKEMREASDAPERGP